MLYLFSQSELQALAKRILLLPYELREMIFCRYWGFQDTNSFRSQDSKEFDKICETLSYRRRCRKQHPCPPNENCKCRPRHEVYKVKPTLLSPYYVGKQIAQEAARVFFDCYYTMMRGDAPNRMATTLWNLKADLSEDVFYLGVTPAASIRRLYIDTCQHITGLNYAHVFLRETYRTELNAKYLAEERIALAKSQLGSLLSLPLRFGIKIEVRVWYHESAYSDDYARDYNERLRVDIERTLEIFRTVYMQLKKDKDAKFRYFAQTFGPHTIDGIEDYYYTPLDEWRTRHSLGRGCCVSSQDMSSLVVSQAECEN
jgi:hypothetical protein